MRSLITIDGPAGAGKTTLAGLIGEGLSKDGREVLTVHMDDLYNGWEDALGESLSQSLRAIIDSFFAGEELMVPQYNWLNEEYGTPQYFPAPEILLLEGVGSGQRITRERATIKLWVDAPLDLAFERVMQRDGRELYEEMRRWQLLESAHFQIEETKSAADYRVKSAP